PERSRLFFFFQAEDGIRDRNVTGVQTCALPISPAPPGPTPPGPTPIPGDGLRVLIVYESAELSRYPKEQLSVLYGSAVRGYLDRSEERRVGKECRARWSAAPAKNKQTTTKARST